MRHSAILYHDVIMAMALKTNKLMNLNGNANITLPLAPFAKNMLY